jgi:large subunit ribosomal protein L29
MTKATQAVSSYRERSLEELEALLETRKKEIFEVRMSAYTDQERSPAQIRAIRRDIARILTILGEKRRQEERTQDA